MAKSSKKKKKEDIIEENVSKSSSNNKINKIEMYVMKDNTKVYGTHYMLGDSVMIETQDMASVQPFLSASKPCVKPKCSSGGKCKKCK